MVVYLSWESESQSSNVDMTSYVEVAICKNRDWYKNIINGSISELGV